MSRIIILPRIFRKSGTEKRNLRHFKLLLALIVSLAAHLGLLAIVFPLFKNNRNNRSHPVLIKKSNSPRTQEYPLDFFPDKAAKPAAVKSEVGKIEEKIAPPKRQKLAFYKRISRKKIEVLKRKEPKKQIQKKARKKEISPKKNDDWLRMRGLKPKRIKRKLDLVYRPKPGEIKISRPNAPERRKNYADKWNVDRIERRLLKRKKCMERVFCIWEGVPYYLKKRLRRTADGGWLYKGVKGTFNAKIGPDGSIRFYNRRSIFIGCPGGLKNCYRGVSTSGHFADPSNGPIRSPGGIIVNLTGGFDITDAIMKRMGQDPYGAEKIHLYRLTARFRGQMRKAYLRMIKRRALKGIGAKLDRIMRRRNMTQAQKKKLIFELWDECREDAGGNKMRGLIIAYIRRKKIIYTSFELRGLNNYRESDQEFKP